MSASRPIFKIGLFDDLPSVALAMIAQELANFGNFEEHPIDDISEVFPKLNLEGWEATKLELVGFPVDVLICCCGKLRRPQQSIDFINDGANDEFLHELDLVLIDKAWEHRIDGLGIIKKTDRPQRPTTALFTSNPVISDIRTALEFGAAAVIRQEGCGLPLLSLIQLSLEKRGIRLFDRYLEGDLKHLNSSLVVSSPAMVRTIQMAGLHASMRGLPIIIEGDLGCGRSSIARLVHLHNFPKDKQYDQYYTIDLSRADIASLKGEGTFYVRGLNSSTMGKLQEIVERTSANRLCRVVLEVGPDFPDENLLNPIFTYDKTPQRLRVPPLRERRDDFEELAQGILKREIESSGIERGKLTEGEIKELVEGHPLYSAEPLKNKSWPGNISELQYALSRVLRIAKGDDQLADSADWSSIFFSGYPQSSEAIIQQIEEHEGRRLSIEEEEGLIGLVIREGKQKELLHQLIQSFPGAVELIDKSDPNWQVGCNRLRARLKTVGFGITDGRKQQGEYQLCRIDEEE